MILPAVCERVQVRACVRGLWPVSTLPGGLLSKLESILICFSCGLHLFEICCQASLEVRLQYILHLTTVDYVRNTKARHRTFTEIDLNSVNCSEHLRVPTDDFCCCVCMCVCYIFPQEVAI